MRYLLVLPRSRRPRRLPLPKNPPTVKKSAVTARFASRNLNRKQTISSGAEQPVGTTYTRTVSSSGQGAKRGKRFDVYIGKTVLDTVEMTGMADALSAVHHGKKT